eukprot:scaffold51106_cov69-Phaeocystis_antarctica.AAC.3
MGQPLPGISLAARALLSGPVGSPEQASGVFVRGMGSSLRASHFEPLCIEASEPPCCSQKRSAICTLSAPTYGETVSSSGYGGGGGGDGGGGLGLGDGGGGLGCGEGD